MSGTKTSVWRNGDRVHRLGLFSLSPQWVRVRVRVRVLNSLLKWSASTTTLFI